MSQALITVAIETSRPAQLTIASAMLSPGQHISMRSEAVWCRCLWRLGGPGS